MDERLISYISGFSISIAAIAGCIRYKQIDRVYRPFLWLVTLAFINELLSYFIAQAGYSNATNSNIYSLAESVMIILLFKRLGLFERSPRFFFGFLILFIVAWFADNFILSGIGHFSSYFTIIVSFSVVLMSISMINRLIVAEVKVMVRHPVFLICMGFVLFFTYALLVEIFWIYGLGSSMAFMLQIYLIMTVINLFVNLIYALAILWMPKKREYTLL